MSKGEWWTILQDRQLSRPPDNKLSYAVKHSVGRGKFKEMAEAVIVPEIVLDRIIKSHQASSATGFWTEEPRATRNRRYLPADPRMGGADRFAGLDRMKGVHETENKPEPKVSGRARALNLRTKKLLLERQPRRPGGLASRESQEFWKHQVVAEEAVLPERNGQPLSCDDLGSVTLSLSGSYQAVAPRPCPAAVVARNSSGPSYAAVVASSSLQTSSTAGTRLEGPSVGGAAGGGIRQEAFPPISSNNVESFTGSSSLLSVSESVSLDLTDDEVDFYNEEGQPRGGLGKEEESGASRYKELGWKIDDRTLLFTDLPGTVSEDDIIESVGSLGEVTNCTIIRKMATQEENNKCKQTTSALVRMKEQSTCEWVISCFHGNTFENSEAKVYCTYALP